MNGLTVIIPSKNAANLVPCLEAVSEHEPSVRLMVIDDGINWDDAFVLAIPHGSYKTAGFQVLAGVKPFIFSRNVNLGIQAAGTDDVILLNDDALLQTPGGFQCLQTSANQHPEFGVIASTCNQVGRQSQWPQGLGFREDPEMVCFVAVLIPRRTIDRVGLLDERFITYGWEDNDYCRRVKEAGLKLGIHDGCYVDHGSLKSTFRSGNGAGDIEPGRQIYREKWGANAA